MVTEDDYAKLAERQAEFWGRVKKAAPDQCWEWPARGRREYRLFYLRGTRHPVHRCALALALGRPLTEGLDVLHSCDNKLCCNPAHLREGTPIENARDRERHYHSLPIELGPAKMGRPRTHDRPAGRHAAYRARSVRVDRAALEDLVAAVEAGALAGDPVAEEVGATGNTLLLRNLAFWFRKRLGEED